MKVLGGKLEYLNEYMPEDRDPVHSWTVAICVLLVAISGKISLFTFDLD